ncbi:hypothetical protein RRV45_21795 [Bacillus sp. DTU_2020_1000418_1_SI_GHA_SEK_038]|nr:hypothetical protein [Bacillus sp. DTU_2020_1000418_1_SI_GHA_SEK_038]WNS75466.1 hypothetical protein RRV45_21795 [Bacillus sp. DTU_2020_1000418_1_SI_GHA_SEK_038]
MEKNKNSKGAGQKDDSMNAMDQGLNLVFQTVNNATGIDKGNDGKTNKDD